MIKEVFESTSVSMLVLSLLCETLFPTPSLSLLSFEQKVVLTRPIRSQPYFSFDVWNMPEVGFEGSDATEQSACGFLSTT